MKQSKNSRGSGNCSFIKPLREIKQPVLKFVVFAVIIIGALLRYYLGGECLFLHVFGVPCPGCGLTRAWLAAFQLDFPAAFSCNFMFPAVPVLGWFILYDCAPFYNRAANVAVLSVILSGFVLQFVLAVFFA